MNHTGHIPAARDGQIVGSLGDHKGCRLIAFGQVVVEHIDLELKIGNAAGQRDLVVCHCNPSGD